MNSESFLINLAAKLMAIKRRGLATQQEVKEKIEIAHGPAQRNERPRMNTDAHEPERRSRYRGWSENRRQGARHTDQPCETIQASIAGRRPGTRGRCLRGGTGRAAVPFDAVTVEFAPNSA